MKNLIDYLSRIAIALWSPSSGKWSLSVPYVLFPQCPSVGALKHVSYVKQSKFLLSPCYVLELDTKVHRTE